MVQSQLICLHKPATPKALIAVKQTSLGPMLNWGKVKSGITDIKRFPPPHFNHVFYPCFDQSSLITGRDHKHSLWIKFR